MFVFILQVDPPQKPKAKTMPVDPKVMRFCFRMFLVFSFTM